MKRAFKAVLPKVKPVSRPAVWAAMCLALAGAIRSAPAQTPSGRPAAAAPAPTPTATTAFNEFIAGEITRLALLDLRTVPRPTQDDYRVALTVLGIAQSLDENSVDIARRMCEAAWAAGDREALLAATQRIVRIDPKDTVAQLRLLTARISRMQTAEQRLATYDAALGDAGKGLDPAIRSRLALDAALLLKEQGDDAGFSRRLTLATQLDSSNKDAALLALNYFSERVPGDAAGRLELLSNLLMADPLDARVHAQLRDELASLGAFKGAQRFHNSAAVINRTAGLPDDLGDVVQSFVLDWRLKGVRGMLDALNQNLASQRSSIEKQNAVQSSAFITKPEDVRLGQEFEEVRLAAGLALQRPNDVRASLTDMANTAKSRTDILRDPGRRPANVSEQAAAERVTEMLQQQHLWQCLASALMPAGSLAEPAKDAAAPGTAQPEPVAATQPAAPAPSSPTPPAGADPATPAAPAILADNGAASTPLNDAWRAIRDHDTAKAKTLLADAGESLWVTLGQAVIAEQAGDAGEGVRAYREVAETAPLSAIGSLSATRMEALLTQSGGPRPLASMDSAQAEAMAAAIPAWVDAMAPRPYSFQSMRVESRDPRTACLSHALLRVRLRNLCPIPLGLGAGRSMNSRLLFLPEIDGGAGSRGLDPEVFEVDTRLRIMPNEELEAAVWPEVGVVGFAVQQASVFPTRVRWRVIQGFETGAKGARRAGLGSVESQLETAVLHEALPENRLKAQEIATRFRDAEEKDLPGLLVAARLKLMQHNDQGIDPMMDALVARYPRLSVPARMLVLTAIPSAQRIAETKELDAVLLQETDPRVLLLAVMIRATGPEDPLVPLALAKNDAAVTDVIEVLKARAASAAAAPPAGAAGQPPADAAAPAPSPLNGANPAKPPPKP